MKKLLIGTALLVTALPFTFDGVTPTVSKAQAVVYRGIHRHVVVHRPFVRRPVLAAAAVGAAATGAGWGWGGWGWNRPLFAYGGAAATGAGWGRIHEPPYTEAEMAAARYGCYPTSFDYSTHVCLPRW
jgi:hypothetical protein